VGTDPRVVSEAGAVALLPPIFSPATPKRKIQVLPTSFDTRAILTRQSPFPFHAEPRQSRLPQFQFPDTISQKLRLA
jgi:hypothetical protein